MKNWRDRTDRANSGPARSVSGLLDYWRLMVSVGDQPATPSALNAIACNVWEPIAVTDHTSSLPGRAEVTF